MTVDRSSQQVIRKNEKSFDIATAMLKATSTKGKITYWENIFANAWFPGSVQTKWAWRLQGSTKIIETMTRFLLLFQSDEVLELSYQHINRTKSHNSSWFGILALRLHKVILLNSIICDQTEIPLKKWQKLHIQK